MSLPDRMSCQKNMIYVLKRVFETCDNEVKDIRSRHLFCFDEKTFVVFQEKYLKLRRSERRQVQSELLGNVRLLDDAG